MSEVIEALGRARALAARDDAAGATIAYLDALHLDPMHLGALLELGALALRSGQRAAARTVFEQAAERHPDRAVAHANLGVVLSDEGDLTRARRHFETALRLEPEHRVAHRGLAVVLLRAGETEAAKRHGRAGFRGQADAWPFRGTGTPISLLVVLAASGPNAPMEGFLDDRVFRKWTLTPEFFDTGAPLPDHDLVLQSIGDADGCGDALDAADAILSRTSARVLNPPSTVRATGRAANAARLGQLPRVVTARTEQWPRESLSGPHAAEALLEAGFSWPVLLRSPGFHGGEYFVRVDGPEELARAQASLPGDTLLVLQFLDTRSDDGKFRKYRVMMVDGALYPLHLAVSPNWKIHYFTADMADRPEHRAEDQAFLEDMPAVLGDDVMQALERIRETLGLDYGGIDFAIDPEGRVVVFEANATMVIVPPAAGEIWKYRSAPVERVQAAVRRMLVDAARRSTAPVDQSSAAP